MPTNGSVRTTRTTPDTRMIGWHYTSLENWERIRREGLRPYRITKPTLLQWYHDATVQGVWVWNERQTGVSHAGSILWQVAGKAVQKVVMLRVTYNGDNIVGPGDGNRLLLHHDGVIGDFPYHDGTQDAYIVGVAIPPDDIELVEVYDLAKAFKPKRFWRPRWWRRRMARREV